uniref:Serine/threonine-protein phosphatase n=2 Tax=Meloidogyne TaxID=189290 RepID=A0A914NW24_MELIC
MVSRRKTSSSMPCYQPIDIDNIISRLTTVSAQQTQWRHSLDVSEREIRSICHLSRELFLSQPMLLELNAPLKIVGDIHGQFSTILLLLCYKLKYPLNFFMLRGNHEVAALNRIYGFYNECKNRVSVRVWKAFQDVFNCLPIAALINGKGFFCLFTAGLSPHLRTMEQLKRIQRPVEVKRIWCNFF